MSNRTATTLTRAATSPGSPRRVRHLRLVPASPVVTYPCLSGCEYAHEASDDYAEDVNDAGHTCIVTVGVVDTAERAVVSVVRWRSTTGAVERPSVVIAGEGGGDLRLDLGITGARALELAALLVRGAELAAEIERQDDGKAGA